MNSMTGFGKAEIDFRYGSLSVEMASVNNRFLEISPRLPRNFMVLEHQLKELITKKLERGKINVYINFEAKPDNQSSPYINEDVAKNLVTQLQKLKKELDIGGEVIISDILLHPEVLKLDNSDIEAEKIWPTLKKTTEAALKDLLTMRNKEGSAIAADMKKRLDLLDKEIVRIEKLAVGSVKTYRERLEKRIEEIQQTAVNQDRLEEEIALMAERTDITEECIRFHSHIKQYRAALKQKGAVGKKLNFILQELNREANTIASKCTDIQITANVIVLKEEIEKLREQVQNVE